MVKTSSVAALAATVPMTLGAFTGFNTGSSSLSGAAKQQADFEAEFNAAHKLAGTNGAFTSSRLYTMIQAGTQNTVISAIPAALNTNTNLLLGLWASGTNNIDNELTALKNAIQQFPGLGQKCVGISVGSEDLYRVTPTGIANDAGVGQDPVVLAGFIGQVKEAIKGTGLSGCPVGHVDTWTAWQNSTANKAVIDAIDWAGTDGYPYFQTQSGDNSIERAGDLFFDSVNVVKQAVGSKPVWVTETGFPWEGPTVGQAVPSKDNAKTYWDNVYCKLKDQNVNTFWYTLVDANSADKATFGVLGNDLNGKPVYDLSCDGASKTNSSSTAVSSPSATGGASVSTGGAQSGSHPEQSTPAAYTNIATTAGPQATQGASTPVYGGSNNTANPGQGSPAGTVVAGPAATPVTTPAAGAGSGSGTGSGTGSGSGSTTTTGARPSTSGFTGAATSTKVASGSIFGLAAAAAAALFL